MILTVDKCHSEGIFDQTGGELQIPSYGLTLFIPPGALQKGSSETISIDVLKDIQPEIPLRHNETLVTYGFQCLPSGLQFVSGTPVRLEIPHCANLIDPTKVQVALFSINQEGKCVRIVQTSRTCRVTNNHVEISLEHFSKGCVAFTKDSRFCKDKRMSFMPFIPKIMGSSRKITLEFRMVNKPHGNSWRDVHEIGGEADYRAAKDDDDEMNVKYEHMEITCKLKEDDTLTENVHASFLDKTKHTVYFVLDFHEKADDLPVKLKVIQSKVPMGITFITRFLASHGTQLSSGKQGDLSNSVRVDAANSSSVTGNTFIGQLHNTNCSGLGGSPRNTRKKTNQKTDSNDKDKGTTEDKQTKSHCYKDDSLDEPPRKRKKKSNQKTDSNDKDKGTTEDKQTKSHCYKDDSLDEPPRKRKKKTNQKTDSNDKDKGTTEDKQRKRHGSKTDGVN
eukprot:XP_011664485.1 PREDICTED: uncharacterized protein LOC100892163 [Strongylocentrotus purpuratus]